MEMPDDCPMYDATSNARDRKEFKLELYAEMWHQTRLLFCTLYLFDLVSEPSHSQLSWELHSMGTPKYLATFSPVKSIGIQLLAKDMPLDPCRTLNACSIMQPNSIIIRCPWISSKQRAFDMIPRYEQHFCHFSCQKDWLFLKLREPEYLKQKSDSTFLVLMQWAFHAESWRPHAKFQQTEGCVWSHPYLPHRTFEEINLETKWGINRGSNPMW